MHSFEAINYALRPNKNVERKMILELLQALRTAFSLGSHQYVGFGSAVTSVRSMPHG